MRILYNYLGCLLKHNDNDDSKKIQGKTKTCLGAYAAKTILGYLTNDDHSLHTHIHAKNDL